MTDLAGQLDKLDTKIAQCRCNYLKAVWGGHSNIAATWATETDRLLDLRLRVQDGPLTATP